MPVSDGCDDSALPLPISGFGAFGASRFPLPPSALASSALTPSTLMMPRRLWPSVFIALACLAVLVHANSEAGASTGIEATASASGSESNPSEACAAPADALDKKLSDFDAVNAVALEFALSFRRATELLVESDHDPIIIGALMAPVCRSEVQLADSDANELAKWSADYLFARAMCYATGSSGFQQNTRRDMYAFVAIRLFALNIITDSSPTASSVLRLANEANLMR